MEDIYAHIGRRVREERIRRGWTQEELADKLNLHLSFVGHLERGIKKPSLRTIQGLAKVFAIKCGDLLDEPLPRQQPYPIEKKFADLIRNQTSAQQQLLYDTFRQFVRQSKRLVGK